ncbi:short-chain fatty acids transporter [Halalkaliarchaeum desulfuricum]|uniref:Short-chain fatty acids transporter n=1 Tax=Halalkaliarchaeum desulfuricum TaxID=2055893 RepID=A0A343TMG5_9EURY|nr:TIGR00366 family protein [Halalkaliarchaeum desulfuricum]AUX10287.1 short-chain fatty acids transporter [Halalkaliarchaeum desulfuricum]
MSTAAANGSAFERLGDRLASVVEHWMPSPFLFAIILTYIAYVAAIVVEGTGPFETVLFWYDGFWLFLTFAMQMVLILMTGFVVAYHPRVNAGVTSNSECSTGSFRPPRRYSARTHSA